MVLRRSLESAPSLRGQPKSSFSLDPQITEVLAQLTEITARTTAGSIQTRITTAKATKQHDAIVGELTEIVNQLVEERGELVGIANALREQLVAQRITPEEITYITEKLIPAVETLVALTGGDSAEALAGVKALVSVEMLTVLQLVGFNFKAAIGEPLTQVVEALVLRLAPAPPGNRPKAQTSLAQPGGKQRHGGNR